MNKLKSFKAVLAASACLSVTVPAVAYGKPFNVPGGDLEAALALYTQQAGVSLAVPSDAVKGVHTKGAKGDFSPEVALARILRGTGFAAETDSAGVIRVMPQPATPVTAAPQTTRLADAVPEHAAASVETVVVTSSKIKGDIQTVPIAITALSQEQLTSRQIAGGPDLVKEVPNLTFSKTNFTGYNIEIRGIGTQAISVTTDPAVAVALNDIPFIRNHFFEQEFYDVNQVEVLRGPQGTLYGRNATAGVVNVITARPTDQFEAMLSADWGNYANRRYEGMVNIPIVDDRFDLRVAGEWTKRNGYTYDSLTNSPVDGRDLWSSRVTLGWKPTAKLQADLIWEHFSEDDDRLRSGKQLCKRDPGPSEIDGVAMAGVGPDFGIADALSQGCLPASLYSPDSFETPNGQSLPYFMGLLPYGVFANNVDPYASTTQSRNLRVIESELKPYYKAKNDTLELNVDYAVAPSLTLSSQTGFNEDFLYSIEDYNRFNTAPGVFNPINGGSRNQISADGVFCDPQLGCSNRIVGEDLNRENSWQLSQELRLASNFSGPFNFSIGGNYLHYETNEDYYVFINSLTLIGTDVQTAGPDQWRFGVLPPWQAGVSDNSQCLGGFYHPDPTELIKALGCDYIDPNPISSINGNGHNYFRSNNPYVLNSYAGFGEAYYNVTPNLKLTGGLRWTDDQKRFLLIPSMVLAAGWGSYVEQIVNQEWNKWTGRAAVNWTPKLDFTDQTLVYGSFAHGYKAGGANPPGAILLSYYGDNGIVQPVHPLTFNPEFINAYELGTKNTLLDGAITLNGDVFYYDYKGYQISQIVDRTSVNFNVDATVNGAELEASYEPIPGLKFNFAGGYEHTRVNNGQSQIDLMDRTNGNSDWVVLKPSITQASNCILPAWLVALAVDTNRSAAIFNFGQPITGPDGGAAQGSVRDACQTAYDAHLDPLTGLPYTPNPSATAGGVIYGNAPPADYVGFDPLSVDPTAPANVNNGLGLPPNNGEGFAKDLSGNQLPNAPHFTASFSAEYTLPVSEDWAATLHSDFYWQSQSFARVFNDVPYDKIRGYSNVNVALILTSANGWQVMGYLKNVFDTTAITGDFLNSDDSGLTTNVFLTDPRLFGVRVTKNW